MTHVFFDMVAYSNELLAQPQRALTPEDEAYILRTMREAQFLADKLENVELKAQLAKEEAQQ